MNVLITGATSGFGLAMARRFAREGYSVIITGRRNERLVALKTELEKNFNSNVLSLCFDVRNSDEVANAIASLNEEWSNVDVLINNAGLALGREAIDKGNLDDWNTMIDTNVKGLLYVTKAVSQKMIERRSGTIINIGSIAGKEVYAGGNVYSASKFAVDAITRSMRIDFLPHNIRVCQVAPGAAETEFSLVRFKGDERMAKAVYKGLEPLHADDVAEVVFFIASRPPHVCINDVVMTPTAQANSTNFYRTE